MVKRYHCDFCDRSFIDDLVSRRKHLISALHQRNKAEHYKKYTDIKTFVENELCKRECKKFLTTGYCGFGSKCYNTHYTKEELLFYKQQDKEEQERRKFIAVSNVPTVESWLETHYKDPAINDYNIISDPNHVLPLSLQVPNKYFLCNFLPSEW